MAVEDVLRLLEKHAEGLTRKQIEELLQLSTPTIIQNLNRLMATGEIGFRIGFKDMKPVKIYIRCMEEEKNNGLCTCPICGNMHKPR